MVCYNLSDGEMRSSQVDPGGGGVLCGQVLADERAFLSQQLGKGSPGDATREVVL